MRTISAIVAGLAFLAVVSACRAGGTDAATVRAKIKAGALAVDVRTLLIALVQDAENLARYLRHLGLPTEVPPLAPLSGARACPPCPCPTRLRRARRLSEGHRSGKAASSAAATASHPTRPRRRRSS